jgi:hypothetical protein
MDEVRIVRRRTHIWPIVIAIVIVALVIAFVLFRNQLPVGNTGWNGAIDYMASISSAPLFV